MYKFPNQPHHPLSSNPLPPPPPPPPNPHSDSPETLSSYYHTIPQIYPSSNEQDTAKYIHSPKTRISGPVAQNRNDERRTRKGTICGVPMTLFCVLVVLVAVAIGGTLGGGLGGGLAARKCEERLEAVKDRMAYVSLSASRTAGSTATSSSSSSSSSSVSPTSSSSSSSISISSSSSAAVSTQPPTSSIPLPSTNCPASNNTLYTTRTHNTTSTFLRHCGVVKGLGDLFTVQAPSWEDCMDACASYNDWYKMLQRKGSAVACAGVNYVPEYVLHPKYGVGNFSTRRSCYLKSGMNGSGAWNLGAEAVSAAVLEGG